MAEFASIDDAANALAAANNGDAQPVASEQAPAAPSPEVDGGTTPAGDSFSNIDPSVLPPELQGVYRNMQSHFTKTQQELKQRMSQYESLGDPEVAAQAVALVQAMQEDPISVYENYANWLESQGLLDTGEGEPQGGGLFEDEYGASDPFRQELDELKAWKAEQEQMQEMSAHMFDIQREEAAIRNMEGRSYSDDDINTIYDLAFAYGGSLLQAEEAYRGLKDRLATSIFEQKGSVPAGVSGLPATGSAQVPTSFDRVDDPALEKAALAALQHALGEG